MGKGPLSRLAVRLNPRVGYRITVARRERSAVWEQASPENTERYCRSGSLAAYNSRVTPRVALQPRGRSFRRGSVRQWLLPLLFIALFMRHSGNRGKRTQDYSKVEDLAAGSIPTAGAQR